MKSSFAIGYQEDSADSQNFSAEWLNAVGRSSGVNYTTADVRTALDALGGDRTPYSYRVDTDQPTQFQVVKYLPEEDDCSRDNLNMLRTEQKQGTTGSLYVTPMCC